MRMLRMGSTARGSKAMGSMYRITLCGSIAESIAKSTKVFGGRNRVSESAFSSYSSELKTEYIAAAITADFSRRGIAMKRPSVSSSADSSSATRGSGDGETSSSFISSSMSRSSSTRRLEISRSRRSSSSSPRPPSSSPSPCMSPKKLDDGANNSFDSSGGESNSSGSESTV